MIQMKIFLDTANVNRIKEAWDMGLIEGVTTNPSLIAKEGRDYRETLKEICEIVDGPISGEVIAQDAEGMIKEGRELSTIHKNIVIKIPMTGNGLKAVRVLESEGIRTNVTLVFNPIQAMLASKAGASFVSPFIGRLDDISTPGMDIIEDIRTIFDNYSLETKIIVASVRHPMHVVNAAIIGADICTIPPATLDRLRKHPLTDIGIQKFLEDAKNIPADNDNDMETKE
jgi:transaldolase